MIDESFLRNVFLFQGLDEDQNRLVCSLLKEEDFKLGERILEEGRAGDALYVIWSGRVRVSRQFDRESFVLTELGPYDFFGEMAYPSKEDSLFKAGKLTQQQIANRILIRRCPSPQLLGSQHLHAGLDASHQLREFVRGKIQELRFNAHR